ncbi:hypothetical protein ACGFNU_21695 [Spirillospora sp. NPDC048911]|uniref:hypothetical protein n=1 Tax=Spirillospora sp. NPDC048911 TaxID=3364527 RepID=UPI00371F2174
MTLLEKIRFLHDSIDGGLVSFGTAVDILIEASGGVVSADAAKTLLHRPSSAADGDWLPYRDWAGRWKR